MLFVFVPRKANAADAAEARSDTALERVMRRTCQERTSPPRARFANFMGSTGARKKPALACFKPVEGSNDGSADDLACVDIAEGLMFPESLWSIEVKGWAGVCAKRVCPERLATVGPCEPSVMLCMARTCHASTAISTLLGLQLLRLHS